MFKLCNAWLACVGLVAVGCTNAESVTRLHLNATSAQAALEVDGIEIAAFSMDVVCQSGFTTQLAGTLDATQTAIVEVPACGAAQLGLTVTAASGLTALLSEATTNLVPGDVQVIFSARKVGKLTIVNDIEGSGQCRIGATSQSPVLDVFMSTTVDIHVPATTYQVFCAENIAEATAANSDDGLKFNVLVGAGQDTVVLLSELDDDYSEPKVSFTEAPPQQLSPGQSSPALTVYVSGGVQLFTPTGMQVSGFPMTVELFAEVLDTQESIRLVDTSAAQAGEVVLPAFSIATAGSYDLFVRVTSGAVAGESERWMLTVGDFRARITAPSSVQAGESFSVTLELQLRSGQPDFGFEGADVELQANDSCLYGETTARIANAQVTVSSLSACMAQPLQITLSVSGGPSAQTTILVKPGPYAGIYAESVSVFAVQGVDNAVTLHAVDAYENAVMDFVGTITATCSDSGATLNGAALPVDFSFTAQDAGSKELTFRFSTLGEQQCTFLDVAADASDVMTVQVIDETFATHIAISASPLTGTTAGEDWSVTFEARNYLQQVVAVSNIFSYYAGSCVGYTEVSFTDGVANEVLTLCTAPTTTIYAEAGLISGSLDVDVVPAAASYINLSPGNPYNYEGQTFTITAFARDDFGNQAADFGSCAIGSWTSDNEDPVAYTAHPNVGGAQEFELTLINVGYHQLEAPAGSCSSVYASVQILPAERFVDAALGNDTGPGNSPSAPKQTLGSALAIAAPGATIYIAEGTYVGAVTIDKPLTLRGGYVSGSNFEQRDTFDPNHQTHISVATAQTGLPTVEITADVQLSEFVALDGITLDASAPTTNRTTLLVGGAVDLYVSGCRIGSPSGASNLGEGILIDNPSATVTLVNNMIAVSGSGSTQVGIQHSAGLLRMAHNTVVLEPGGSSTQTGISWSDNEIEFLNNLFYGDFSCSQTAADRCALIEGQTSALSSQGNVFISKSPLNPAGFGIRPGSEYYDAAAYNSTLPNHGSNGVYQNMTEASVFQNMAGADNNVIALPDNNWQLVTAAFEGTIDAYNTAVCGFSGTEWCFGNGLEYSGQFRPGAAGQYSPGAFDVQVVLTTP